MKLTIALFALIISSANGSAQAASTNQRIAAMNAARDRAQQLITALASGDWTTAARYVYLDPNTRARMGIRKQLSRDRAQAKIEAWFKRLYDTTRPGHIVSVTIDSRSPTRALVSYTHEDLDAFAMRYVNGNWYYVVE